MCADFRTQAKARSRGATSSAAAAGAFAAGSKQIRLSLGAEPTRLRGPMFLMLSKHPRKQNRNKTKRFRAKLAAKNRARRNRIYCRA